jgi:hypothetical protein
MKSVDELVAFSDVHGQGSNIVHTCTYSEPELRALAKCLVELPMNSRVVEIGTFAGRTASLYFQLQKDLNLDIHLIDNLTWHPETAMGVFNKMIATYFSDSSYVFYKTTSQELGKSWDLPINFLHVDGDHSFEGVQSDCELWLPHMVSGGMIGFHDIVDGSGNQHLPVAKAIDNFVRPTWEWRETVDRTMTWRKP